MYEVLVEHSAERDLKRLPKSVFARIIPHLSELRQNPRPPNCRKITGSEASWRVRVGDYRIIYEVDDELKKVMVMRIKHRREVYR
ncbi:MAG: type II toxin-antitoxin system RelE/ParE family toxin [bacterium]|nr:type II toxin-antitoxin system RelE/ParE family toxin [bacterium]